MSIETALRRHLDEGAPAEQIGVWVDNEDRMVMTVTHASGLQEEFVAEGDRMVPK